jgi:MFS family permease
MAARLDTRVAETGGWWGPAAFTVASVMAARRLPGYSARSQHVSGLAARGSASASTMVPGFVALGVGQLALGHALDRHGRRAPALALAAAGIGTIGAGVFPVSTPACPMPGQDPDARPTDTRHAVASVATFGCWVAMPFLASSWRGTGSGLPAWHRRLSGALVVPTTALFLAAGVTTRRRSPWRGLAQRAFLGTAFAWQAATSAALIARRR